MRLLLDTHLLLWSAGDLDALPAVAAELVGDVRNELYFSVANIWEIAIKHGQKRNSFKVDPEALRRGLLRNRYSELSILSEHTFLIPRLPAIHRDPFDRILIAQAIYEGITLLTSDSTIAQYAGPIQLV